MNDFDDNCDGEERTRGATRGEKTAEGGAKALQILIESDPRVKLWLASGLDGATAKALDRLRQLADLQRLAVMPDVHPAADVCVGTVIATSELIYPQAIGGDIGCGMSTVALSGLGIEALHEKRRRLVLEQLGREVPILTRSARHSAWSDGAPAVDMLREKRLSKAAERDGLMQLGTLGRGNHFLEVQADDDGRVWLMVHSGSRAMGQTIARHYTNAALHGLGRTTSARHAHGKLLALSIGTEEGRNYLADQQWAVLYAAANRRKLLVSAAAVLKRECGLKADWESFVDLPHNFVRLESHGGLEFIVHRKGASPAASGQAGLIPGSAGTFSAHVEGRGNSEALCSSSHGAGRVLSRGEARKSISAGKLRRQLEGVAYDERMEDRMLDEAPGVYRDLRVVLEAQRDLVRVVRRLKPVISYKGG
ncbi:MAG: RtcB family protein [Phycisphaerales bacterium]|nr:RtcB family protein [Phycisphaerales bacterium]